MDTSAPNTPTVAVSAARKPKRSGGNQAAAIFSVPMKVAVAPSPTRKRPTKSTGSVAAAPIITEPTPITAPPAASTRRTPQASSTRPAGTISGAYA